MKDIGNVTNSRKSADDDKTLDQVRFVTGDYLDVAVYENDRHRHPTHLQKNRR
jgi:hypothetical protein